MQCNSPEDVTPYFLEYSMCMVYIQYLTLKCGVLVSCVQLCGFKVLLHCWVVTVTQVGAVPDDPKVHFFVTNKFQLSMW